MFLIKPGGLRNVGRSRQRKQENEENDLWEQTMKGLRQKANNRDEWASVVKQAKNLKRSWIQRVKVSGSSNTELYAPLGDILKLIKFSALYSRKIIPINTQNHCSQYHNAFNKHLIKQALCIQGDYMYIFPIFNIQAYFPYCHVLEWL
jgi:hypothetical protein